MCDIKRINMKKEPIYALDFDGVICDSAIETAITGWKCAQQIWTDMAAHAFSEQHIQQFRIVRPLLETGYEAILIMRLLHNGISANMLCEQYHQQINTLIENEHLNTATLITRFGTTRDQWIKQNEEEWLSKNPLFTGIQEKLQQLEGKTWYIITTKQERFVKRILSGYGITLSDKHIYGMDKQRSKSAVLQALIERHSEQGITFIEDRLPTLFNIINNQTLDSLNLQLADWGYNSHNDKQTALSHPIEIISLNKFLNPH